MKLITSIAKAKQVLPEACGSGKKQSISSTTVYRYRGYLYRAGGLNTDTHIYQVALILIQYAIYT